MGITFDADFRQMHHSDVASLIINCISPQPSHLEPGAPMIRAGKLTLSFWNKITIVNDDGNPS